MSDCAYCRKSKECRPYGAKGEMICFDCAMTPANKATTDRMYATQLAAAGSDVVIGEETGPRPQRNINGH